MTSFRKSLEQMEIQRRLDAMLDFTTFRSDGHMRSIGKRLRTQGKTLTNEQAGLLMDVGIFDLYEKSMRETMPLIELLNKIAPEFNDNEELVQIWSIGKHQEYVLARICLTIMAHPDLTEQIISTMALMDLKGGKVHR